MKDEKIIFLKIINLNFIFFLLFLFCQNANATDISHLNTAELKAFNQVKHQLAKEQTLFGNFKQIRNIALLSKPLISTGTFTLSNASGLTWQQTKPFESTLIVTNNTISQHILNNPPTVLTKKEQPLVFAFTHIFLSLFQGNIDLVKSYFRVDFTGDEQNWQVKLIPLGAPLDKAINSIVVKGGQYVSFIEINQPKGDQMEIYFSDIKAVKKV